MDLTSPEPTPKRGWFHVALRTLFVALTVMFILLAGWIGYQLNWIRQRHEYLEDQAGLRARFPGAIESTVVPVDAPGLLWLFGERGRGGDFSLLILEVDSGHTPVFGAEIAKARTLFPETNSCLATIVRP
ncbi:MAG TPA: hypothetical protein VL175_08370 [Pirellulales bacterium]|jgi:hypothetical protein|nr:hypothetical protein [Pirellulales bacterium]